MKSHASELTPRLQRLEQAIEKARVELDIPAVMVTIVDKDRILFKKAFGVANRDTQAPARLDHYFRIGSITKVITALATLHLIETGKLSLQDKLLEIAPDIDVQNPWYATHPITIEHLLEHSAGFNDLTAKEFSYNEPFSLKDAFKLSPGSRVSQWPPGLHYSYSNLYPGLLAYVIEKISGQPFADYVKENVLKPIGMQHATLLPEKTVLEHLITGYDSDGHSTLPYWHMTYSAFAALNIQLTDMAALMHMFLNQGDTNTTRFLPTDTIKRMLSTETTLAARQGLDFGYGFSMYTFFRKGHVFYGHGGDADGYLSRMGIQPESGLGFFVGINVFRGQDLTTIRHLIEDYIIENQPEPTYPKIDLAINTLKQYTGRYESVTWRFPNHQDGKPSVTTAKVFLKDDALYFSKANGKQRKLIPVTKTQFRFLNEPMATMAFVENEGALYLQSDLGNFKRVNNP